MKILFTRSGKLVSRLIRHVTGEPVSHCAIQVGDWVLHSNFLGVHPQSASSFNSEVEVWGSIELPTDYQRLFELTCGGWGKQYDWGAMFYLLARWLLPFLPKKNLWQCSGMYLCSEWVDHAVLGENDAMITPYQLYKKLGGTHG